MNRIYRVVWSKVKGCYVVVSELAGTAKKSGRVRASGNTLAAVLAAFLLTGISVSSVSAALDGVNTFVEPGNQNIKIGNDIDLRNNSTKNGAIAIGDHAQIDDYVMQEGSIAIGKNAFVENMWGTQDKIFRFGMHSTDPLRTDHLLPAGIAIGQNTYARSGVMIGDHKYVGALGDTTVNSNTDNEKRKLSVLVGATTVGLNSYSAGAFATTTGAYSIMTNAYDGDTNQGSAAQNFGAVINGSFNSIESKTSGSNVSGIANAVVGTANRTYNANGTLVFGAGNEVTNSVDNIANPMSFLGLNSPKELAEKLREDIRRNDSGGAVLAVGGGNKADYAYRSQLIGVGNTLKGTAAEKATYNLLNGYKNTGTNVSGVTVIGSENEVENSNTAYTFGPQNKEKNVKHTYVTGEENNIEDSEDVRVVGKGNTVKKSDRQNVFGDNNSITERDRGTVSGYHGITRNGTSDLVIGRGNKIEGNDTYMKGYESLTVIGNNNETVNPSSGIVIGDNQTFHTIKESVIIGSMTPEEKASGKREQGGGSVVVGYNAQSGSGLNVAVGHSALALGYEGTVTGHNSVIEDNDNSFSNVWSSIYGVNNKITSDGNTSNGLAGSIIGTWNKLDNADNSMIFGSGNILSHATVDMSSGLEGTFGQGSMTELLFRSGYQEGYSDQAAKVMGDFANTSGSVLIAGNGNRSDYARRSQIVGTGNILNGTANGISAGNTMAGFRNTGTNVNRVAVVGTGNKISDGTSDVVIGDYHEMSGGTNNVVLGAMATKEDVVSKTYTPSLGNSSGAPGGYTGIPIPYNVRATVPTKTHTANVSNAVMLGYNTDVQKSGGVALGSESVSSVDAGVYGYSPDTNQNIQNDTEIANLTGKTARLAELNGDLPGLSSAYTAKKADYEGKVTDFLEKSAEYTQAYQTYHSYEHSGDQYDLARKKKMDDAKTVMDTAQTAMNSAKADYTDAETKYNSALGERNLIIGTWKATAAAVSVGDVSRGITRQITGVAAGTQDTDAVNVAQLKAVRSVADAAKVHYYSAKSAKTGAGSNYDNDGAKAEDSIVLGISSSSKGGNSTVLGNNNKLTGVKNGRNNSIVAGQNLEVEGVHNAVFGTDYNNYDHKLTKVFGEQNTVLGVGNLVGYTAEKDPNDPTKWIYTKKGSGSDQNVAVGMTNTANGGSVVLGTNSLVDDLGTSVGHGNEVVGSNDGGGQRGLALGNKLTVKGEEAVAVGTDASATADWTIAMGSKSSAEKQTAMAFGYDSHTKVSGGVALGSWSVADRGGFTTSKKGVFSDFELNGKTAGAVSVGTENKLRQIIHVGDATEDTDAVNLRQLKAVKDSLNTTIEGSKVHFFSVKGSSGDENYNNDGATGDRALAVGVAAKAGGLKATALTGGNASGDFSFAVGNNAQAKGWGAVAIGSGTLAEKQGTVAIGHGAKAYSLESVALGYNTQAGAPSGQPGAGNHAQTAMGSGTIATGGAATAFGFESVASGAHAIAGGDKAKATGQDSVALGKDTEASGTWSVALGSDTKAEGQSSTALGTDTTASGIASTAMGSKTQATGVGSTAMGGSTTAAGGWSLASGGLSEAKGDYSTAMGYNSKANAKNSFAVSGGIVEDAAENSIAMGKGAKASVSDAVALGSGSVASTEKGKVGYDFSGDDHSNDTTGVWKSTANAVSVGDASKGITRQITGVAAGSEDTDAVNVAQLKKVEAKAEAAKTHVTAGDNVTVTHDSTTNTYKVSAKDTYTTGGTYDAATKKIKFTQNDPSKNYEVDVSGLVGSGGTGSLTFAGDTGSAITKNSGEILQITGGATEVAAANNIGVVSENGKLNLKLAKNIDLGSDGSIKTGNTKMDNAGLTIAGGPSVTKDGIDAGSKKITHVAAGEISATSTDAVNGSQLHAVKNDIQNITNNVTNIGGKVNKLDTRVNRVGAGAAALAALHPLDFDPDDKWDFAVGYGNYKDAHAVAVGAFYRPNEDTMLSVGGSLGGGENMVNAGLSVKLGQGNGVSTSKVAMAKEIVDLKADNKELRKQVEEMNDRLNAVLGLLDAGKTRDFPDVPENHWAYEYIRVLAGNGLIQGYPDGTFGGNRSMTRYEFAALLYRALKNGAPVDDTMDRAMNEFEPELRQIRADRIRVDRVSGKDNDRNKVERVHINNDDNKDNNDYRDVYGSRISAEMK